MITPKALAAEIGKDKFRPAYFFYGLEDYRIAEGIKYLTAAFLSEEQRRSNVRRLDCRRDSFDTILTELASLPLLGERQVLVIAQFQRLHIKQVERVLALLEPPDANRVVIFSSPSSVMARGRKAFTGRAFFKRVAKSMTVVEFEKMNMKDARGGVQRMLKSAGVTIEPQALELLVVTIAGNRGGLEGEVNKLIDYTDPGGTVTIDDIRKVCSGYEVFNVFELADQIVTGSTGRVIKMLDRLLADGQTPVGILSLLQGHFMSLYLVRGGRKLTGPRAWLTSRFAEQARHYKPERLEDILCELATADADLRGGPLKPESTLQTVIVGLMQ